jgi:hypothetical protein
MEHCLKKICWMLMCGQLAGDSLDDQHNTVPTRHNCPLVFVKPRTAIDVSYTFVHVSLPQSALLPVNMKYLICTPQFLCLYEYNGFKFKNYS